MREHNSYSTAGRRVPRVGAIVLLLAVCSSIATAQHQESTAEVAVEQQEPAQHETGAVSLGGSAPREGVTAFDEDTATLTLADRALVARLIAEHVRGTVAELESSHRGRDAALALLLRPLSATTTSSGFALGRDPSADAEANWYALFDDLDGVPLSLLHALAWHARDFADNAQWARYESTLLRRDGANLASWLHRIGSLQDDPAALDAWLRRAAQRSDRFDSLSYDAVRLMVDALAKRPMGHGLAGLLDLDLEDGFEMFADARPGAESAEAVDVSDRERWVIAALGLHMAVAVPTLRDLSEACSAEVAAVRPARRAACLGLIRRALPGAGNLLEQGILARLWVNLAEGTAEASEARQQLELTHWYAYHGATGITQVSQLSAWLDYFSTPRANELGWLRRRMSEQGVSPTPPDGWKETMRVRPRMQDADS